MRIILLALFIIACVPQGTDEAANPDTTNLSDTPTRPEFPVEEPITGDRLLDIISVHKNGAELSVKVRLKEGSMDIPLNKMTLIVNGRKATLFQEEFCDFILSTSNYCYDETDEDFDMVLEKGEVITVMYTAESPLESADIRFMMDDELIGHAG